MPRHRFLTLLMVLAVAACVRPSWAQGGPEPPSNVMAADKRWDKGDSIVVTWDASPSDVVAYSVERSRTPKELDDYIKEETKKAVGLAVKAVTDAYRQELDPDVDLLQNLDISSLTPAQLTELRARRLAAIAAATAQCEANDAQWRADGEFIVPGERITAGTQTSYRYEAPKLLREEEYQGETTDVSYRFRVLALGEGDVASAPSPATEATAAVQQPFDGTRFYLLIITFIFCGSVMYWIFHARSGREIRVRKIGGLAAVDEAVGRATEMGRSILFVPGIQDMNEIQTIAGITILSRVARLAAEYDAKIEVPTARSLVMTACRETVQASFLEAGRPDAYNQDNVHYVTNEQFGYVAYLSGMMVREKPAACFYMGAFFAESLILAETGNAIGAIQVAGTAQPAQLPFFVAACDYTLIGEEFFAASAYLTQSPEELGSLKGQDVGKVVVAVILVIGVAMATVAQQVPALERWVDFLKSTVLT